MNRILAAAALALAAGLAACSKKEAAAPAPSAESAAAPARATAAAGPSSDMSGMAMSDEAKMATGSGTVTAVDAAAGTITLDHGPIPEASWPAMKMTFKAAPGVAQSVKVGDRVNFNLRLERGHGEVTAIQRQ